MKNKIVKPYYALLLLLIVFMLISSQGIGNYSNTADFERVKTIEDAIQKAAVQCYAIEGSYPPFEYLVTHYGLIINEEAYYYHYELIASNIKPIIAVYKKW